MKALEKSFSKRPYLLL